MIRSEGLKAENQYTNREVRLPSQYTNRAAQHYQYTNREERFPYQYTDSGGGVAA